MEIREKPCSGAFQGWEAFTYAHSHCYLNLWYIVPGHLETWRWDRLSSTGGIEQLLPALPLRPEQFSGWKWARECGRRRSV